MSLVMSPRSEERLDKYNEKKKLLEYINEKRFKVSDIPLSYRQVNVLSSAKLLGTDNENKGHWRKFSFKELVYIALLVELKKFGFDHKQIRRLYDSFFKNPDYDGELGFNKDIADTAIACVFAGVEISVLAFSDGVVYLYDPTNFLQAGISESSYIRITLNHIVNDILVKIGKEPVYPELTVDNLCSTVFESSQTIEEKQVMDLLRSDDYSFVKVKKKDGKINVVYAERDNQGKNTPSSVDLINALKESDFQDISITKRDGKIVNYRVEQAFKL